jgi:hypothetical protein
MLRLLMITALCALVSGTVTAADAQVSQISQQEANAWLDYTIPLPKQIQIKAAAVVPKGAVGIEIRASEKSEVYDQIRQEFLDTCGPDNDASDEPLFWITIKVDPAPNENLTRLKNSDQAYQISASADNKSLTVSALTYRGAYYGWKTLQQLIKGRSSAGKLTIPLLAVTDWPDMEKRGIWGVDNFNHLPWFADRKMNHMEQITDRGTDSQGNFYDRTRDNALNLIYDAPRYAIDYAPVVLHLEQAWQAETTGKFHPEVASKGGSLGTLCYAEPKTTEMISEWIYQLAKESPTAEVDVWMTENMAGKKGCQCDECRKHPYALNEARAIVKAWEMAKQKLGRYITMYMLTSEATESENPKIFAELPRDVRIWYYHSLLTYNSIRQPMLKQYIADAAKGGRWMGVCPNLDAWTHLNVPFTNGQFIKYRMDEFVGKGLQGLLGYPTPRVHYHKFNVEAAAEWTWNNKGRTARQFAYSYAVRQGYKDPALFADWTEKISQVAWDVFGSGWPAGQLKNAGCKVKTALKDGTMTELGFVLGDAWPTPWGNIKSEKQFTDDLAAARKAVSLAEQMGIDQYKYESIVVDGYIRNLEAVYQLKQLAPKGGSFTPANQAKAKQALAQLVESKDQVVENLPKWEACVAGETEKAGDFVAKPIAVIKEVTADIVKTAADMDSGYKAPADPSVQQKQARESRNRRHRK